MFAIIAPPFADSHSCEKVPLEFIFNIFSIFLIDFLFIIHIFNKNFIVMLDNNS